MQIAKIENGTVTVAHYSILFPNTSFGSGGPTPDWLLENNAYQVVDSVPTSSNEKLELINPELRQDNKVYIVRAIPKTAEDLLREKELLAAKVKEQRNKLLQESDWTQLPDAPVDKVTWAGYRQQLRDVPNQPNFPEQVVWPTTPQE